MSKSNLFLHISRPFLLDVTLRDGGYLNDWNFKLKHIETAVKSAGKMGADIIEVGYLDDKPGLPLAASCPPKLLKFVKKLKFNSLIAAMVRPSVEKPGSVLQKRKEFIDLVRIPVDLRNTHFANNLSSYCIHHNIPFTFNLTSVSCYSLTEIQDAVESLNSDASAIYIADSRGALIPEEVKNIVDTIKRKWNGLVGYHAHNNLGLALKNTEEALRSGCDMIDGSLSGIGLGGRNLDLKLAVKAARKYRNNLPDYDPKINESEEHLGVAKPADEMPVFYLSGERNIKMEWVQIMIEQLGVGTASEIIMKIPRCTLFHHYELKEYIEKKYWDQLIW